MILLCTFKSLIKIVEPKNTEFLCGKVVSGKSVLYNWRRREKKHRNSWTLYNKFSRENIAKIFFFRINHRFYRLYLIHSPRSFLSVLLLFMTGSRCKCIIVFSAIMDKTRNFLHCSAKTLYALNVGDSYWTIQRHNLESIHCDDRTSALSFDRKKSSEWRSVEASSALCLQFEISTFH